MTSALWWNIMEKPVAHTTARGQAAFSFRTKIRQACLDITHHMARGASQMVSLPVTDKHCGCFQVCSVTQLAQLGLVIL